MTVDSIQRFYIFSMPKKTIKQQRKEIFLFLKDQFPDFKMNAAQKSDQR